MYIVGFKNPIPGPEKNDTIMLSLGTDGVAGNTCIMTNKKTGKVSVVYAIQ
jgi:hypothetical protein